MGRKITHAVKHQAQAGFTLLEILLVIVMIAVTSAMVVPSLSSVSSGSVAEETNRLRLVMRYALEETQLSGVPLRWVSTKDGWFFESLVQGDSASEWVPYETPPLETYELPQGIEIKDVEQAGDFAIDMAFAPSEDGKVKLVVIGMVLLLPDGTTSQTNIHISSESDAKILEVRPGPAGVKVKTPEQ